MSQSPAGLRRAAAIEPLASPLARRVLAVALFATLTALSARTAVPLPGGVPVSLQTLMVLLSGLLLGPVLGASAQVAYLLAGVAGLPVFAGGGGLPYLFGPTGGYLLAFPVAAAAAGGIAAWAHGGRLRRAAVYAAAALAATLLVYAGGWAQLTAFTGDAARALRLGVLPFLLGDALKIVLAVAIADRLRGRTPGLL